MIDEYCEIPLVGKHGEGKIAIVDPEDFEYLTNYRWFYAGRRVGTNIRIGGRFKKLSMHRAIMDPPKDKVVDHINGNILDNRRINLRVCTQAENTRNRGADKNSQSGFKGVSFSKFHQKWTSYITLGKRKHIGYFECPEEAARAYDYYALKKFGEFAWLNFENEVPQKPDRPEKKTSKYRGISWGSRDERFIGRFTYKGLRYNAGNSKTELEAAIKFNKKVREVMGDEAHTKLLIIERSGEDGGE